MKFILTYNEAVLFNATKQINIDYTVNADKHYYDRLSRTTQDFDINGNSITYTDIIDPVDVENDIKTAMSDIIIKNLFNNGIFWVKDKLNKELIITNEKTDLNTVLMVEKEKNGKYYKYNITIKTIMRKKGFIPSGKENTFQFNIK
jgi:hypothetical protein